MDRPVQRRGGIRARGEKGFTLIELLIVVAILGVLAAVAVPNLGRFIGSGRTQAAATELDAVQSAVDSMMVDLGITSITSPVSGSGATNMGAFPSSTNASQVLYPNYMRTQTATYSYNVTSAGVVTQTNTPQ